MPMSDLQIKKILVVGCGGLGCELLKLLVEQSGISIVVIDDDTIDASNLNRQFLFTAADVGKSKSEVVAAKLKKMREALEIENIHGSIRNYKHIKFYEQFSVIYNCLDNNETRSFVNQRSILAGVVMVDGGSAGWLGQSFYSPNDPGILSECFDCLPQKEEEIYPVCSVRQLPKNFKHCLIWASQASESHKMNLKDSIAQIYRLACDRAKEFQIEPFSLLNSETFLRKIIPSVCTTNSMVASLMIMSYATKKHYYLVQSLSKFISVELTRRKLSCTSCSIPLYRCEFSNESVGGFLSVFGASAVCSGDELFSKGDCTSLECLDGMYGVVNKDGLNYGVYFEYSLDNKMSINRIK